MKTTIYVPGSVPIDDVLEALNLGAIPDGCSAVAGEGIFLNEVAVSVEAALDEIGDELEPETLADQLNEDDVIGLAEAIRAGNRSDAEYHLDRLFGNEHPLIREWIDRGRYSRKARVVKAA